MSGFASYRGSATSESRRSHRSRELPADCVALERIGVCSERLGDIGDANPMVEALDIVAPNASFHPRKLVGQVHPPCRGATNLVVHGVAGPRSPSAPEVHHVSLQHTGTPRITMSAGRRRPDPRYPKDWPALSRLTRAYHGNRCLSCGKPGNDLVLVLSDGSWQESHKAWRDGSGKELQITAPQESFARKTLVRLQVAHLDHNPSNCAPENLATLCVTCHSRYDAHRRRSQKTPFELTVERDGERKTIIPGLVARYGKTKIWLTTAIDEARTSVWLDEGGGRWCVGEVVERNLASHHAMHLDRTVLGSFLSPASAVNALARYSSMLPNFGRDLWEHLGSLPGLSGADGRRRERLRGRARIPAKAAVLEERSLLPGIEWWLERVDPTVADVLLSTYERHVESEKRRACLRDWTLFCLLDEHEEKARREWPEALKRIRQERQEIVDRQRPCVDGGAPDCPWVQLPPTSADATLRARREEEFQEARFDALFARRDFQDVIRLAEERLAGPLRRWRSGLVRTGKGRQLGC